MPAAPASVPEGLRTTRLERWHQTPQTRIPDPTDAAQFIEAAGLVTLYPVSTEVPNLFHAYVGDPEAETSSKWDSPSGHVYTWRWELGRADAGFYTAIVRNRPTWVAWRLLPAVLRLRGDLRTPDELFDLGVISAEAYRIAAALDEAGGVLSTGDLRARAGFPSGKEQRSAYLKGVAELDSRLLLAKVFSAGDEDMRHALVSSRYPDLVSTAESTSREDALLQFLRAYLPHAVYAVPLPLSRHLGIPLAEVRSGLGLLAGEGAVEWLGAANDIAVWRDSAG